MSNSGTPPNPESHQPHSFRRNLSWGALCLVVWLGITITVTGVAGVRTLTYAP